GRHRRARAVPAALRRADRPPLRTRRAAHLRAARERAVGDRRVDASAEAPRARGAKRRAGDPRAARRGSRARSPVAAWGGVMADRPGAAELVEAVREFIEAEVLPVVQDSRLRFRVLVAANALTIAQRDLEMGDELLREEIALLERLCGTKAPGGTREQSVALSREL